MVAYYQGLSHAKTFFVYVLNVPASQASLQTNKDVNVECEG